MAAHLAYSFQFNMCHAKSLCHATPCSCCPCAPPPPSRRCVNLEDQLLLRLPDALSSPADAATALAAARYYLFGVGDLEGLLQVRHQWAG